jgi:aminoglycoside phosphotransferase (APT) family kinase protein
VQYFIETDDRKQLLLRIADIAEYDRKKTEYEMMEKAAPLNIPMSQPVDFGTCNGGKNVYTLLTWIDGEELESILPALSETEQYSFGIKSGEILRKIHKISAPQDAKDWSVRYFKVIDERLDAFRAEGVPFDGNAYILDFLEANRHLLKGRPQCRHHGDYHEGNMILSGDNELFIIDWRTVDFENRGDPWIELARYSGSSSFTSGQINGYFKNKPPKDFWVLFAYYLAASAITSIVWAKHFAPERLDFILQLNRDVLLWFGNMNHPVPTWYLRGNCYDR